MKESWFIEEISAWDMTSTYACLHLSNYNLQSHEEIEKRYDKEISKLRWIVIEDAIVKPGSASGFLIIEGKKFALTYAWGRLYVKDAINFNNRESFTVKIKGKNCGRYFTTLQKE